MPALRPLFTTVLAVWPWAPTFSAPLAWRSAPLRGAHCAGHALPCFSTAQRASPVVRRGASSAPGPGPADKSGEAGLKGSFGFALLGTCVLAAALVRQDPAALPALGCAAASLEALRSAAGRGRLDGGTFKVLSLGLAAAFSILFFHGCFEGLRMFAAGRLLPWRLFLAAAAVGTAVPAVGASYKALQLHGVPKFKVGVQAEGRRWLGTLVALGYASSALHQLACGAALLLYHNAPITGALRCFVVAACAHVCQTAAVAGPKRLSSETYRTLNLALMLDGLVRLVTVVSAQRLALAPAVALLSATTGWVVGKLYTPA